MHAADQPHSLLFSALIPGFCFPFPFAGFLGEQDKKTLLFLWATYGCSTKGSMICIPHWLC